MADDNTTRAIGENGDSNESARIDNTQERMTPVVSSNEVPEPPQPPAAAPIPTFAVHPKSAVPVDPHENETEYERAQRLKLNTDEAPHSGVINDDIAQILKGVKLPERRDANATADQKKYSTAVMPAAPVGGPAGEPASESAAKASDGPPKRNIVTALHTLKDDMQDIVMIHKMTQVRATALEQDKKRGQPPAMDPAQAAAASQRNRRTVSTVFFAILLIVLGLGALYGVIFIMQSQTTSVARQYPSIIFAEQTKTLPLDGIKPSILKQSLANARNGTGSPLGAITRIIPVLSTTTPSGSVTVPANLPQFLSAINIQPPDQLMRGLGTDFFFGIHTVDVNGPVIIIPVTSYDLAFAGMLAWEPNMNSDLSPIFDAVPALVTGPDGLPTQRTFSDAVILNYDVRELKDDAGAVVLYYSFPTPNLLIIAESVHSFPEILSRLQAQRLL